jgi:hypothetical protein
MKKVYISGPISGIPNGNVGAFIDAYNALKVAGYDPVNPYNNGLPGHATWHEHMRADIRMLLDCDGVALLPGWYNSKGAQIERQLAYSLDMDVRDLQEWLS